jgi:hypothetical protein
MFRIAPSNNEGFEMGCHHVATETWGPLWNKTKALLMCPPSWLDKNSKIGKVSEES